MPKFNDLSGKVFGRLHVLRGEKRGRLWHWLCQCSCGERKWVLGGSLTRSYSATRSCGCLAAESMNRKDRPQKHGHAMGGKRSPTLNTWEHMKRRCYSKNSKSYKYYGGRGVKVCDRWLKSFSNFLEDMGEKPEGKSIDRIDNNKGYSPENCRWATTKEQTRNQRSNVMVLHNDKIVTLSEFAEIEGIPYNTAHAWKTGVSGARKINILGRRGELNLSPVPPEPDHG